MLTLPNRTDGYKTISVSPSTIEAKLREEAVFAFRQLEADTPQIFRGEALISILQNQTIIKRSK